MLDLFLGKVNSNSNIEFKSYWYGTPFSQGTQDKFLIVIMNFGGLIFVYLMRLHSQVKDIHRFLKITAYMDGIYGIPRGCYSDRPVRGLSLTCRTSPLAEDQLWPLCG